MADKKKIALCISGKPTSSMFCFPYIYDAFLNNNLDVDVFIHTWNECRVIDLYKPKKINIEKSDTNFILSNLLPQIRIPENTVIQGSIQNVLLEYYGMHRVFSLVDTEYDYIIRCRFDILVQDKFDFNSIIDELNENKYDIFCPDEIFNFGGYQNRVFLGKYSAMKHAMNIIENVNELTDRTQKWHPEIFLKEQLDINDVVVHQKDINHRIVRSTSVVTNWPENPFKFLDL